MYHRLVDARLVHFSASLCGPVRHPVDQLADALEFRAYLGEVRLVGVPLRGDAWFPAVSLDFGVGDRGQARRGLGAGLAGGVDPFCLGCLLRRPGVWVDVRRLAPGLGFGFDGPFAFPGLRRLLGLFLPPPRDLGRVWRGVVAWRCRLGGHLGVSDRDEAPHPGGFGFPLGTAALGLGCLLRGPGLQVRPRAIARTYAAILGHLSVSDGDQPGERLGLPGALGVMLTPQRLPQLRQFPRDLRRELRIEPPAVPVELGIGHRSEPRHLLALGLAVSVESGLLLGLPPGRVGRVDLREWPRLRRGLGDLGIGDRDPLGQAALPEFPRGRHGRGFQACVRLGPLAVSGVGHPQAGELAFVNAHQGFGRLGHAGV